ncbi:Rz-like spanin [Vibrio phage K567]|nr:hypothetical protein MYOV011v1_p0087 [Vibrio phage 6E35.1a]
MFAKYKIYIGFAAILVAVLTIGYLKLENSSLEKSIAEQTATIERLTDDKTRLEHVISDKDDTIDQWQSVYLEQSVYRKALQTELDEKTGELRRYRDRQDVVFQKPGLVQIKEQKALDKFFNEVRSEK